MLDDPGFVFRCMFAAEDELLWADEVKQWVQECGWGYFKSLSQYQIQRYYVEANLAVRQSGKFNFEYCKYPVPCPWDIDKFEELLGNYEDRGITQFMRYGWLVEVKHVPEHVKMHDNQRGARENSKKLGAYVLEELNQNSIIGPFDRVMFKNARISPIDALPKNDSTDVRVILNLSFPPESGKSVNDAVDKDVYLGVPTNLTYPTIDDLVDLIHFCGDGCALMKVDLRKYYRQIFVDPGSVHLLGFQVDGELYWDISLSMGLRIAWYIAQRISSSIMFIFRQRGFLGVNYLDDLASACVWSKAFDAFEQLYGILSELKMWESAHKRCPPDIVMDFLGIRANTLKMTLFLTDARLVEIKQEMDRWNNKQVCTKKEVQRLIGKLSFAASTVRVGRLFFSRIISFMTRLPRHGVRQLDA